MQLSTKIVLLGSSEVGKSCIALRFARDTFTEGQSVTLGAAYLRKQLNMQYKGKQLCFRFDLWDTAGQERFSSIAPMYYRGAQFALIVYDISNEQSYQRAKDWVSEIKEKSKNTTIIALCGNKCDLPEQQRQIPTNDAKAFAEANELIFYETSAKDNINIQETFTTLAEKYLAQDKVVMQHEPSLPTVQTQNLKKSCC